VSTPHEMSSSSWPHASWLRSSWLRSSWLRRARDDAVVLVGGWGACALALPDPRRPALVLAALGAGLLVVTIVMGWRVVGSLALLCSAGAVLMAGALEPAAARPVRLLLGSALLLLLVLGLDRVERQPRWTRNLALGPRYVRLPRVPTVSVPLSGLGRRTSPPVTALAVASGVAAVSTIDAPPSVLLVLLGLLAGVAAVVTAIRLH
jgi:hypothetical protein